MAVVDGYFALNSGATLTLTGGLTVAGTLDVDAYTNPTQSGVIGGTTLTINGGLVDTGTVAIGDAFLTADDTVTATSLAVSYGDYLTSPEQLAVKVPCSTLQAALPVSTRRKNWKDM